MCTREQLNEVLARLPDDRLGPVYDFARFLAWEAERDEWQSFGLAQLARAYGDDEPDYSNAEVTRPEGE
jgi:hypothetical protein